MPTRKRERCGSLTVRMKFVDLRRSGWQRYDAKIKTPDRVYVAGMLAHKNLRAGVSDLYRGSNVQECDGLSHEIDYAEDVVVLRVPRDCLGNPSWVRVQGINFLWPNPQDDEHLFADNPHTHEAGAQKAAGIVAKGQTLTVKLTHVAPDFIARLSMDFFPAMLTSTPNTVAIRPIHR